MERRNFLKGTLITMGSLLLGAKAIHRFLNDKEPEESPLPRLSLNRIALAPNNKLPIVINVPFKKFLLSISFHFIPQMSLTYFWKLVLCNSKVTIILPEPSVAVNADSASHHHLILTYSQS